MASAHFRPLHWLWRASPLLIFGLLWHGLSNSGLIDPVFLPEPYTVFTSLLELLRGRQITDNLFITLFRAFTGLALGAAAGIWTGMMMARSAKFRAYVTPIVGGTYSLPKSALIPLFILWFGIGSVTAISAVFLACLLPMIVNTLHGVQSTPKVLVWSAEALGYTQRQMLGKIFLPLALPDIMTGLRIALGFSFVLAISSEMIAATSGIGKLIFMYGENGAYSYMFAAIACVVVVAFICDRILLWVTRLVLSWHESAVAGEAT
jgi:NitT/TauT family transport system permease protein